MSCGLLPVIVVAASQAYSYAHTVEYEGIRELGDDQKHRTMSSRTALLLCALVCFVVFFYFMLSVACQARNLSINTDLTPAESIKEVIANTFSRFQRRALLESFFKENKVSNAKNGKGIRRSNNSDESIADTSTNSKKMDEECPVTPLSSRSYVTNTLTPDGRSPPSQPLENEYNDNFVSRLLPKVSFPVPFQNALGNLDYSLNVHAPNEEIDSDSKDETDDNLKDDRGDLKDDNVLIDDCCSICLDTYETGDEIVRSKHCVHAFHKECILDWLELKKSDYKCPCCRNDMLTNDELCEAATEIVGKQEIDKAMQGLERRSVYLNPLRRRTYSNESPVFVPDL